MTAIGKSTGYYATKSVYSNDAKRIEFRNITLLRHSYLNAKAIADNMQSNAVAKSNDATMPNGVGNGCENGLK